MKIQQLVEEQMNALYDRTGINKKRRSEVESIVRKLIEALGSELINNFMEDLNYYNPGKPPCTDDSPCGCHFGEMFHADGMCLCDIEKKQRLKLKEILSNIK